MEVWNSLLKIWLQDQYEFVHSEGTGKLKIIYFPYATYKPEIIKEFNISLLSGVH